MLGSNDYSSFISPVSLLRVAKIRFSFYPAKLVERFFDNDKILTYRITKQ